MRDVWKVPHKLVTQVFLPKGVRACASFYFEIDHEYVPRDECIFSLTYSESFEDKNDLENDLLYFHSEETDDWLNYTSHTVLRFNLQSFFESVGHVGEHAALYEWTKAIEAAIKKTLNTPRTQMPVLYKDDPDDSDDEAKILYNGE
jgi:hypothetical protein